MDKKCEECEHCENVWCFEKWSRNALEPPERCEEMREENAPCGPDGRLWERKEKE